MRVTWIGGWGMAPESLRPVAERFFAGSQHTFVAPTARCVRPDASADLTVAWSLGAWRVLDAASRGVEIPGMVLLLAPFVAFPAESSLGGKCSGTQVKFLRRWLQREPLAALADFQQRAGLTNSAAGGAPVQFETRLAGKADGAPVLPYAMPDLLEGLDRLAEDASPGLREFAARGLPRNWQALIGDDDALLEAEAVRRSLPGCVRLRGVGHAIGDLLQAAES
jgi:hypothetical protein